MDVIKHSRPILLGLILTLMLLVPESSGLEQASMSHSYLEQARQKAEDSDFKMAMGLYLKAAESFISENKPYQAGLAFIKAGETALTMGDLDDAVLHLKKAQEMNPSDGNERIQLRAEYTHLHSNILSDQGKYGDAIKEMHKTLQLKHKSTLSSDSSIAMSLNNIGYNFFWLSELDSALFYYKEAAATISTYQDAMQKEDMALYQQNIGIIMAIRGKLDSALAYMQTASTIYEGILEDDDPDLAKIYLNLGRLHRTLGDDPKAFEFNTKAEKVYVKHFGTDYAELGVLYLNTGNILKVMGDYEKSVDYYRKSLHIYTSGENPNHPNVARVYNNLGAVYLLMGEDSLAEHYLLQSMEIGQQKVLGVITYRNLANIEERKGNYREALNYLNKASIIARENIEEGHYELGNLALDYGIVYSEMNEVEMAMEKYDEAIESFRSAFGNKHPDLGETISSKAALLLNLGRPEEALHLYQESLIALSPDFEDTDPMHNPKPKGDFVSIDLLDPILGKATAFWGMYQKSMKTDYLQASLNMLKEASSLVDIIRNQVTDNSKQMLTRTQRDLYDKGIRSAFELHHITNDQSLIDVAFQFAEKSKYAALLSSMRDVEAREFAGIPDSLREREKEVNDLISAYVKMINDENLAQDPNTEKLATWESLVFDLQREQEELIQQYEENYPRYFRLKYDTRIIDIKDIQKRLDDNTVLVEYFMGDTTLYSFFIGKNEVRTRSTPYDSTLTDQIQIIRNAMQPGALSSLDLQSYKNQQSAAYRLYEILLGNEADMIQAKNLVIIPDDILGYLSFDLLLSSPDHSERMDYRTLPYLIREHEISYSYLATLNFDSNDSKQKKAKDVIAFAPAYDNIEEVPDEQLIGLRGMEKYLLPIEHARAEMELVKRITDADVYLDDEASETVFKEKAIHSDIIHLAMHTVIDDHNPMFSKLAFSLRAQGEDDGLLNTYEIYNMDFDARLVVLSACNTGSGKLQRGEGIISLARAFMYAGVPSIVMTLWAVEDKSGYEIMEGFYENLADGQSKRQALRNAKLDYLETADNLRSHPYFWAAYVNIGDDGSMYSKNKHAALIAAACLILIALILILFIRLIRRRRKTTL